MYIPHLLPFDRSDSSEIVVVLYKMVQFFKYLYLRIDGFPQSQIVPKSDNCKEYPQMASMRPAAWAVARKLVSVPAALQRTAFHMVPRRSLSAAPSAKAAQIFLRPFAPHKHQRAMSMSEVTPKEGTVGITIIDPVTAKDGRTIQARIGASVLDVAQEHDMVCFFKYLQNAFTWHSTNLNGLRV